MDSVHKLVFWKRGARAAVSLAVLAVSVLVIPFTPTPTANALTAGIVATDLAARGIDVPEMKFIIHYQLPIKGSEFTHRNGRTARMNTEGTAYILRWEKDAVPHFIDSELETLGVDPLKLEKYLKKINKN